MTTQKAKIIHAGTIVDGMLNGWVFGEYEVAILADAHTDEIVYGGHTVSELQPFARQSNDGVDFLAVVERAFLDIRGTHRTMGRRYNWSGEPIPPRIVFINADSYFGMTSVQRVFVY